jgi:hypothetical protein
MEEWWSSTPDEHLIVAEEEDGKFYIWEGTHRFALSMIHGMNAVPAFVGYKKRRGK